MPNRRAALGLILAAGAGAAAAHTPYRQWVVYRQRHLVIGSHRGDLRTFELAEAAVAALASALPEASARVARGPRAERMAALLGTGQLSVAVLAADEAAAMAAARPPFADYPPTPLAALAALEDPYALFARPDLPDGHAWLIAEALHWSGLARAPGPLALATHPGAAAYWRRDPLPG